MPDSIAPNGTPRPDKAGGSRSFARKGEVGGIQVEIGLSESDLVPAPHDGPEEGRREATRAGPEHLEESRTASCEGAVVPEAIARWETEGGTPC